MAADLPVEDAAQLNSCCKPWRDRCSKLKAGRECLREAVKVLDNGVIKKDEEICQLRELLEKEKKAKEEAQARAEAAEDVKEEKRSSVDVEDRSGEVKFLQDFVAKAQKEVSQLKELLQQEKNAREEERDRVQTEKGMKEEEVAARVSLENEISVLKSELMSLKQKGSAEVEDKSGQEMSLPDCGAKTEMEINQLKELLEKERKRADSEKRIAEAEKKKAAEAWTYVKKQKAQADEQRKFSNIERKKAEEYRLQLESMKKQAVEANSKLASVTRKMDEFRTMFEAEKCKVIEEKKRGYSEMAKVVEQRKLAEESKKAMEEKSMFKKQVDEAKLKLVSKTLKYKEASSKLEAEKHKLVKERKRAHSEMVKAEEQRKLAEENRKMAMNEKSRADRLSHRLEEYRIKIEELPREARELVSSRVDAEGSAILSGKGRSAETTKVKLLKKQLKLEKARVKHAKEVADLEKKHTGILLQELSCLKLDFFQMSCRLNALTTPFSVGAEDKEKVGDIANMQVSKLNRSLCRFGPCQQLSQSESQILEPSCMAIADSDPLGQTSYRSTVLVTKGGGVCGGSISGIDSKLESLHGVSNRKLLESSAINSSSASFSDGQLVGSQERRDLVTAAGKFVEENFNARPTIPRMSHEATRAPPKHNLTVAAENNFGGPHSVGVGRVKGRSRKRRRTADALKSVELLYAEDEKLHLQMEKDLSLLQNEKVGKGLPYQKYVEPDWQVPSSDKCFQSHKKIEASHEERVVMQGLSGQDVPERTKDLGNEACYGVNASREALIHDDIQAGTLKAGGDVLNVENIASLSGVAGNYMKLMELDNSSDEECYRKAMQIPLSPTLPDIQFPNCEMFDEDKLNPSFDGSLCTRLPSDNRILVPSQSLDLTDGAIGYVEFKDNASASGTYFNVLLHENEGPANSFCLLGDKSAVRTTVDPENASGLEVEMPKVTSNGEEGLMVPLRSDPVGAPDSIPAYCVVFSNVDDNKSMSRIFCATRSCMNRCSLDKCTEFMVPKILHALKMEERISPMEKACAFFTSLLLNFSIHSPWGSAGSLIKNFVPCIDWFAGHINAVVSDVETRSLFAEVCCLDELLGLIENFLLERRVLVYSDSSLETLSKCDSRISILLNGAKINVLSRSASADQLVMGAIILASICAAVNRVGFICEVSYGLLRMHKCDTGLTLTILHVFAYLCEEFFSSLKKFDWTMTVVKSVVIFLERKGSSLAPISHLSTTDEARVKFSPCAKCPFSEDALSIDIVASELLKKLQSCALSETKHSCIVRSASLSNSSALVCEDTSKLCSSHDMAYSALDMNFDAYCSSDNCTAIIDETLHDLSDLLSLVELLACNVGWVWTYGKIIPVLLELLEKVKADDCDMAVIVLLGQLGRLGVLACGYEDKGVTSLRHKLSSYFWRNTTNGAAFPVQIATVIALLAFTPLVFENVIQSNSKSLAVAGQSDFIDLIRNWFSSLKKEQQVLSLRLLQSASVVFC